MTAPLSAEPAPGFSPGALPGVTGGRGQLVEFVFFMEDVNMLMNRAQAAISGLSLGAFLKGEATEFFHNDIESRFNEEGDVKTGFWPPLTDTTIAIRESQGFGADPINRRTDEMFEFLMRSYPVEVGEGFASMNVPGDPPDSHLLAKLQTAQSGSDNNPRFPGHPTPPRPVLAVSEMDAQTLMELLAVDFVGKMMESGALG